MPNISGVQNTQEVKEQADVYEGQLPPSYMQSDDFEPSPESKVADTASVGSKPCYNSDYSGHVNPGSGPEESSNYIQSDDSDYPPPGVGSDSDSDILDAGSKNDSDLDDLWNDFNDEDLWDETGGEYSFKYIDPEKLDALFRKLTAIMNLRLILANMIEQKRETLWMLFQTFSGIDISGAETKASLTQTFAKSNEKIAKFLQQGITTLLEEIQEYNDEVMAQAEKDAKEAEGNGWTNFWNSNEDIEDAMKIRQQAREDYEAAMQKSMDAVGGAPGGGFDGLNSDIDGKGDNIVNTLGNAEDYIEYDGNGYIDTSLSKDWIVDLRQAFMGILNLNRILVSSELQRESLVKMVNEVRIGRGDLSNRLAGVEDMVEIENTQKTVLFDFTAGEIIKIQTVKNDIEFLDRQIEKLENSKVATGFANFFKALAIVVAVVATIVIGVLTFGSGLAIGTVLTSALVVGLCAAAAVCGALSATCSYVAAEIQNAVSDQYDPSIDLGLSDDKYDNDDKDGYLDRAEDLEQAEEEYLNSIGLSNISTLGDGNLSVDNEALAQINSGLNGIQNLQRLLMKCIKDRRDKNQAVFRTFTGISSGSSSSLMVSAVDSLVTMSGVRFTALTSKLSEYANAKNTELAQERAIEAARTNFWIQLAFSVVSAVVGAFTGGAAGVFLGWSVGQALGAAIGKVVNATRYPTKDISLDSKANKWLGETGKSAGKPSKNPGASMDHAVNDIYSELLTEGTCNSGDGFIGLDTNKIMALQKRLQKIMMAISNMTSIIEGKSKAINSIWQGLGVITDDVDSIKDMISGTISSEVRNFRMLTNAVQEQVEVHNRANTAQQEYEQAWTNFGVTVGLLGISAVAGLGSGLTEVFSMGVSVTSAANSAIDFGYSMLRAKNDTGELDNMVKDSEDYKSGNASKGKNTTSTEAGFLDHLSELETDIQMDNGLIGDIGGDDWGVNSGELTASMQALDRINRMCEILVSVLEQKNDVMALVGKGARPAANNSLSSVVQTANTFAQMILQTQFQGIQQLVDRHNQINAAETQAILSGVNGGFSVASAVIKGSNMKNAVTIEQFEDKVVASVNNEESAPTAEETIEYNSAKDSARPMAYAEVACGILGSMTNFATSLALFSTANDSAGSHNGEEQVEKNNKQNTAENRSELNYGSKLDEMEKDAAAYAMAAGAINMEVQFAELLTQLDESLNQASESLVKGVNDGVQGVFGQIKNETDSAIAEEVTREALEQAQENTIEQLSALGANTQNLQNIYNDINTVMGQMDEPSSNLSVLSQRLDQLIAEAQAEMDNIITESAETSASLDNLEEATEAREQALSSDQQLAEFFQDPELPAALVAQEPEQTTSNELQQQQDDIKENREEVSQSVTVTVDGEEMQVTLTGEGVTIQAADGQIMSLTQYLAEKEAKAQQNGEQIDLENDPVLQAVAAQVEHIQETGQSVQAFEQGVISSQTLAEASQIIQRENEMEIGLESLNQELETKQTKPLTEMSKEELQQYYETIYRDVFVPTRRQLGKVLAKKQEIQSQMRACEGGPTSEEYQRLQVQLDDQIEIEGQLRTKIRAFNKHIGQVNNLYREKTNGQDLTPAESSGILAPDAPEVAEAPTTQTATGTAETSAAGSDPVDTVELSQETDRNLETVGRLVEVEDAEGNVTITDGSKNYSKEELKTIQTQLEQALEQSAGQERENIEKAIEKLDQIIGRMPDTTGAAHTSDAAMNVAAAEDDEVEEQQESEGETSLAQDILDLGTISSDSANWAKAFLDVSNNADDMVEEQADQLASLSQNLDQLESVNEEVFAIS